VFNICVCLTIMCVIVCVVVWTFSEKMDVQDHYTAWRQTQEQPSRRHGNDGPFSFCSYPFLLDPRAKSNLLHIEARFQMEQVCGQSGGGGEGPAKPEADGQGQKTELGKISHYP